MTDTLEALLVESAPEPDTELAARVAGGLRARGVGVGSYVAWQLPNGPEPAALFRACWRLGAVAVPLHARAGPAEVSRWLADLPAPPVLVVSDLDEMRALAAGTPVTSIDATPHADAVVLFTAGSTGAPKGVRHRHDALAYKAKLMVSVHDLGPDDVALMPAPLSHISGLLNGVLVPGAAGMRTVWMARWSPDDALALIERERVSFMVGPPTFFVDLMDAPTFAAARVATLRLVSSGGAGVRPEFVDRASETLGAFVKRSYGSTEAPTVATSVVGDDPARVRACDGHAIGSAELRVVDGGELQVRGPELFAGYLSTAQTAAAMTDDGWFRTGDLATIDADGWLTITGRSSEVIIRAGENIAMAEVEAVLELHPAVRRAAVVGEPDARVGERIVALVELEPSASGFTLDDCKRWFVDRGVARFKTPEMVVVVDELPRLPAGKVDRVAVRALLGDRG